MSPISPKKGINSTKLFFLNSASCLFTTLLQLSLLIWVNRYLLKKVSAEEYSILPLVMSLFVVTEILTKAATGGVGRFLIEADAKGNSKEIRGIVSSILPVLVALSLLFTILGGFAAFNIGYLTNISDQYTSEARLMLFLLLIPICLEIILTPFTCGIYVKQKFVLLNSIKLISEALRVTLVLLLLLSVSDKVIWVVVGSSTAAILNLGLRFLLARKIFPDATFSLSAFSWNKTRKLLNFGVWSAIGGLSNFACNTVPVLLLGKFGTSIDVACFYLGRLPDQNIRKLSVSGIQPIQPILTSIFATQGIASLQEAYYRGGKYHMWIALPLIAPLILFGPELMNLYVGSTYLDAAWVMIFLLGTYPIIWASSMFYRISHASAQVGKYYRCEVLNVIIVLVATFLTVKTLQLGALGAAASIALSTVFVHIFVMYPLGLRQVDGNWNRFAKQTLLPGVLPFLASSLTCLAFRGVNDLESFLAIAAGSLMAALVYFAVLLLFCLDENDQKHLKKGISKIISFTSLKLPRTTA